jgi:hypothetical protein
MQAVVAAAPGPQHDYSQRNIFPFKLRLQQQQQQQRQYMLSGVVCGPART